MSHRKPLSTITIKQIISLYKINEIDYAKIERSNKKIERLNNEIAQLKDKQKTNYSNIDFLEERVKQVTNGYTSKDLIKRVDVPVFKKDGTPALDKAGNPRFKATYVLKYPDTIFPPKEDNIEESECFNNPENIPGNPNECFDIVNNNSSNF